MFHRGDLNPKICPPAMLMLMLANVTSPGYSHPLPDGVIERAIQIVVYPDRMELRYRIGMNDKMAEEQLAKLDAALEPAEDQASAISRCRDHFFDILPNKLSIEIAGETAELRPLRADLVRQHHANIECVYEVPVKPTDRPAELTIADSNFAKVPGSHEIAIRGRNGVAVAEAEVRSSLGRREPSIGPKQDPSAAEPRRQLEAYFRLPTQPR